MPSYRSSWANLAALAPERMTTWPKTYKAKVAALAGPL